jgi:hypothetical protein
MERCACLANRHCPTIAAKDGTPDILAGSQSLSSSSSHGRSRMTNRLLLRFAGMANTNGLGQTLQRDHQSRSLGRTANKALCDEQ